MKLLNYICENQMNIFDIMNNQSLEPPIILTIGQIVYKVIRGDVYEFYVYDEKPWLCGDNNTNRGYRLKEKDGCYGCAWNTSLGVDIFTNKQHAINKAEIYLQKNDCIRKENINPVKTVAYSYVRDTDNRTMKAFYSILDNGMVYVKEFMTFSHLSKDVDKAIKKFMEQPDFKNYTVTEIEYQPTFDNMYSCNNDSGWNYAEARYNWHR